VTQVLLQLAEVREAAAAGDDREAHEADRDGRREGEVRTRGGEHRGAVRGGRVGDGRRDDSVGLDVSRGRDELDVQDRLVEQRGVQAGQGRVDDQVRRRDRAGRVLRGVGLRADRGLRQRGAEDAAEQRADLVERALHDRLQLRRQAGDGDAQVAAELDLQQVRDVSVEDRVLARVGGGLVEAVAERGGGRGGEAVDRHQAAEGAHAHQLVGGGGGDDARRAGDLLLGLDEADLQQRGVRGLRGDRAGQQVRQVVELRDDRLDRGLLGVREGRGRALGRGVERVGDRVQQVRHEVRDGLQAAAHRAERLELAGGRGAERGGEDRLDLRGDRLQQRGDRAVAVDREVGDGAQAVRELAVHGRVGRGGVELERPDVDAVAGEGVRELGRQDREGSRGGLAVLGGDALVEQPGQRDDVAVGAQRGGRDGLDVGGADRATGQDQLLGQGVRQARGVEHRVQLRRHVDRQGDDGAATRRGVIGLLGAGGTRRAGTGGDERAGSEGKSGQPRDPSSAGHVIPL
jgi:hypothetical protein